MAKFPPPLIFASFKFGFGTFFPELSVLFNRSWRTHRWKKTCDINISVWMKKVSFSRKKNPPTVTIEIDDQHHCQTARMALKYQKFDFAKNLLFFYLKKNYYFLTWQFSSFPRIGQVRQVTGRLVHVVHHVFLLSKTSIFFLKNSLSSRTFASCQFCNGHLNIHTSAPRGTKNSTECLTLLQKNLSVSSQMRSEPVRPVLRDPFLPQFTGSHIYRQKILQDIDADHVNVHSMRWIELRSCEIFLSLEVKELALINTKWQVQKKESFY